MQFLSIRLGAVKYGIPIDKVISIEQHDGIIKLPCEAENVTGIKNLHGKTIPIYNLSKKFGGNSSQLLNIVIVSCGEINVGLEVDSVAAIENADNTDVENMPQMISYAQHYMNNVAHKGAELTVMIDIDKLLDEEEKQAMENIVKGE